jgi:hypothetical protein
MIFINTKGPRSFQKKLTFRIHFKTNIFCNMQYGKNIDNRCLVLETCICHIKMKP